MWTGLSQFTNALKEQAESVVRESGLDGQLVRDSNILYFARSIRTGTLHVKTILLILKSSCNFEP